MENLFEKVDLNLCQEVECRLCDTLTSEQLISYVSEKGYNGVYGLTHERFNQIVKWFVDGKIKLVNSAWKNKPEEWRNMSKKPLFVNAENYKLIETLKKNKKDWDENWREYQEKYPIWGTNYIQSKFWMGEMCSRNTKLILNDAYFSNLKVKPFQFLLAVYPDKDNFSLNDYGQEYLFEFNGEDKNTVFVEEFKECICSHIARQLLDERIKQLMEEETTKIVSLFK